MAFLRVKWIKNNPYLYLQSSVRVGDKVVSKHIKYIGKFGSLSQKKRNDDFPFKTDSRREEYVIESLSKNKSIKSDKKSLYLLSTVLSKHSCAISSVSQSKRVRGSVTHSLQREDKITKFLLTKSSTKFTWFHELGHVLDIGDNFLSDKTEKGLFEFINEMKNDYKSCIHADFEIKNYEDFVDKYSEILGIRQNKRLEKGEKYNKSSSISEMKKLIQDTKNGSYPPDFVKAVFKRWASPDYRLTRNEIVADLISGSILNHKYTLKMLQKNQRQVRLATSIYTDLYKHFENKYNLSL